MPQNKKDSLIIGFALFSMFFGAGNLTLPPLLGLQSGTSWGIVAVGFILSGVVLPILAIYAHAKLQGTMLDFGNKVSPVFSFVFCLIIYCISIIIPAPRTASLTHEMGIAPYFESSSLLTSSIYFLLVFLFVIKRQKILDIIGKFLTPLIVLLLLSIIGIGITLDHEPIINYTGKQIPFLKGLLEGYQTFDAIGGMLIGGVLIISLNYSGYQNYKEKKAVLIRSGLVAGLGLAIIYTGLIALGALRSGHYSDSITRSELLTNLSLTTLDNIGTTFLSVLVSLACFTTAVGIVTGTSDYFKGLFKSDLAYKITALTSCLIGVGVGQLDFHSIIVIAIPVLMIIYPITIVLIILNTLPKKWSSDFVFRSVIITTILFSLPDMFYHIEATKASFVTIIDKIPLANQGFGWFIPSLIVFIFSNVFLQKQHKAV